MRKQQEALPVSNMAFCSVHLALSFCIHSFRVCTSCSSRAMYCKRDITEQILSLGQTSSLLAQFSQCIDTLRGGGLGVELVRVPPIMSSSSSCSILLEFNRTINLLVKRFAQLVQAKVSAPNALTLRHRKNCCPFLFHPISSCLSSL